MSLSSDRCLGNKSICFVAASLVILVFVVISSSLDVLAAKHNGDSVIMGWRDFVFDDACVFASARMSSGTFFDSLQRIEGPEGTTYKLNSKPWRYYPEELTVVLIVKEEECPKVIPPVRIAGSAKEFMSHLDLNLAWKDNLEIQAIKEVTLTVKPPSSQSTDTHWEYIFQLKPRNIPLTSHLLLSVYDLNHHVVSRFSGRP